MGVQKLQYFISESGEAASTGRSYPLPGGRRATVLLDTASIMLATAAYAAYLEQRGHAHGYLHPDGDLLGGEAPLLAEACRRVLTNMRGPLAMDVVLVRDATRFAEAPPHRRRGRGV